MTEENLMKILNDNRKFCTMSNLEKDRKLHDYRNDLESFKNWRDYEAGSQFKKVDDFLANWKDQANKG